MRIRFDHAAFQRTALWSAAGGAAMSAFGPLPVTMMGSAVAVALACVTASWRSRILAACAFAPVAIAWAASLHPWLPWACGGAFGLLLAALAAADADGDHPPRVVSVAATAACAAAAVALGSEILPSASASLAAFVPDWIARAAAGGALGLWAGLCSAPLYARSVEDPLESRVRELRKALEPELRAAADRAVADALREHPDRRDGHGWTET